MLTPVIPWHVHCFIFPNTPPNVDIDADKKEGSSLSLYGALYAGVSGLQAQSNKLGIISDNIANVNTIGYKQGSATFETLVTNAGNTGAYSPGGVLSGNEQLVSQQGLLQTTTSPT